MSWTWIKKTYFALIKHFFKDIGTYVFVRLSDKHFTGEKGKTACYSHFTCIDILLYSVVVFNRLFGRITKTYTSTCGNVKQTFFDVTTCFFGLYFESFIAEERVQLIKKQWYVSNIHEIFVRFIFVVSKQ